MTTGIIAFIFVVIIVPILAANRKLLRQFQVDIIIFPIVMLGGLLGVIAYVVSSGLIENYIFAHTLFDPYGFNDVYQGSSLVMWVHNLEQNATLGIGFWTFLFVTLQLVILYGIRKIHPTFLTMSLKGTVFEKNNSGSNIVH